MEARLSELEREQRERDTGRIRKGRRNERQAKKQTESRKRGTEGKRGKERDREKKTESVQRTNEERPKEDIVILNPKEK